jgi:hypothetical protein
MADAIQLVTVLQENGFQVLRAETHDRTDYDRVEIITCDYTGRRVVLPENRRSLLAKLRRGGGTLADRGDNLYLLARKPGPGEARATPPQVARLSRIIPPEAS